MLGIIIPTYDNLKMLKDLITQVYLYTKTFRLYVIEDGQKKETVSYLKSLKFDNLKTIFHKENKGVAVSWNDGLKEALKDDCQYFAILNDDIELCKNWWDSCKNMFRKADMVSLQVARDMFPARGIPNLTGWFFILNRKTLDKVGFFDEEMGKFTGEDTDYAIRFSRTSLKFGTVDIPIKHLGSATLNKIKKQDFEYYNSVRNDTLHRLIKKHKHLKIRV